MLLMHCMQIVLAISALQKRPFAVVPACKGIYNSIPSSYESQSQKGIKDVQSNHQYGTTFDFVPIM